MSKLMNNTSGTLSDAYLHKALWRRANHADQGTRTVSRCSAPNHLVQRSRWSFSCLLTFSVSASKKQQARVRLTGEITSLTFHRLVTITENDACNNGLVFGARLPLFTPFLFLLLLSPPSPRRLHPAHDPPNQTHHARRIRLCSPPPHEGIHAGHYASDYGRCPGQYLEAVWDTVASGHVWRDWQKWLRRLL